METHDPNVYSTILWGVLRGFWSPFLDLGALSAIFWHLKTGTFGTGKSSLLCQISNRMNRNFQLFLNQSSEHFSIALIHISLYSFAPWFEYFLVPGIVWNESNV